MRGKITYMQRIKEAFSEFFDIFNKHKPLAFVLCIFVLLTTPIHSAHAFGWLLQLIVGALLYVIGLVLFGLAQGILYITSAFLLIVADPNFITMPYAQISFVKEGIILCQGLAGIFMVIALISIGIGVALNLVPRPRDALVNFITAGILIFITPIITGPIIDFANIFMYSFLNTGAASGLMANMGVFQKFTQIMGEFFSDIFSTSFIENFLNVFIQLIILLAYAIMAGFTYMKMAALLLARYVFLWLLMILSPLAFAMWPLKQLSGKPYLRFFEKMGEQYNKWWNEFIGWTLTGISASFFIYLSARMTIALERSDVNLFNTSDISVLGIGIGNFGEILTSTIPLLIPLMVLQFGASLSGEWGAIGAKAILSAVDNLGRMAMSAATTGLAAAGGAAVGAAAGSATGQKMLASLSKTTAGSRMLSPLNKAISGLDKRGKDWKAGIKSNADKRLSDLKGISDNYKDIYGVDPKLHEKAGIRGVKAFNVPAVERDGTKISIGKTTTEWMSPAYIADQTARIKMQLKDHNDPTKLSDNQIKFVKNLSGPDQRALFNETNAFGHVSLYKDPAAAVSEKERSLSTLHEKYASFAAGKKAKTIGEDLKYEYTNGFIENIKKQNPNISPRAIELAQKELSNNLDAAGVFDSRKTNTEVFDAIGKNEYLKKNNVVDDIKKQREKFFKELQKDAAKMAASTYNEEYIKGKSAKELSTNDNVLQSIVGSKSPEILRAFIGKTKASGVEKIMTTFDSVYQQDNVKRKQAYTNLASSVLNGKFLEENVKNGKDLGKILFNPKFTADDRSKLMKGMTAVNLQSVNYADMIRKNETDKEADVISKAMTVGDNDERKRLLLLIASQTNGENIDSIIEQLKGHGVSQDQIKNLLQDPKLFNYAVYNNNRFVFKWMANSGMTLDLSSMGLTIDKIVGNNGDRELNKIIKGYRRNNQNSDQRF